MRRPSCSGIACARQLKPAGGARRGPVCGLAFLALLEITATVATEIKATAARAAAGNSGAGMVEGLEEEVEVEEADSEAMPAFVEFTNVSLADPEIDLKGSVPLVAAGSIVTRLVPPVIGNEEHAPFVGLVAPTTPMA